MTESATGVLVKLDDQATLDAVGRRDFYLARVESDGTIVLTPAVVMKVADLNTLVGTQNNGAAPKKAAKATAAKATKPKATATAKKAVVTAPVGDVSAAGQEILDVVKKAGASGISAGDIVKSVSGARSRIYNALAQLRRSGQVSNGTGKYVFVH